ncbi:MAG: redoxin domain-containing protein [Actinomycetota bacterium]|nr:redoxin domain-containing protein [Actinomycetota bacterium]
MPAYEDRGLNVLMVSIDPSETEQSIEQFNDAAGIEEPLPTALDDGTLAREFDVNALETTIILDREGEVVFRETGPKDKQALRQDIEQVL